MKPWILVWALLPMAACAGENTVQIDADGKCRLGKQEQTAEQIGKYFAAHPDALGARDGEPMMEISCDPATPVRAVLDIIRHGALARIAKYAVAIDGKTVHIELPKDKGVRIAPRGPGAPLVEETAVLLHICSTDDRKAHSEGSDKIGRSSWESWENHAEPLMDKPTSKSAAAWIGTDSESAIDLAREKAPSEVAAKAAEAAKKAGGEKTEVIVVRCDPDVAAGIWHSVLAALEAAGVKEFDLASMP